jgi:hypothetical protein
MNSSQINFHGHVVDLAKRKPSESDTYNYESQADLLNGPAFIEA